MLRQTAERGFRETDARRAIVETVSTRTASSTPASFTRISSAGASAGRLSSRTLDLLVELGVLNRLHTDERCSAYIVCADQHHHHLVCERCGAVQEISDARIERAVRAMAVETGFRAREHHLEIVGVCATCQAPG